MSNQTLRRSLLLAVSMLLAVLLAACTVVVSPPADTPEPPASSAPAQAAPSTGTLTGPWQALAARIESGEVSPTDAVAALTELLAATEASLAGGDQPDQAGVAAEAVNALHALMVKVHALPAAERQAQMPALMTVMGGIMQLAGHTQEGDMMGNMPVDPEAMGRMMGMMGEMMSGMRERMGDSPMTPMMPMTGTMPHGDMMGEMMGMMQGMMGGDMPMMDDASMHEMMATMMSMMGQGVMGDSTAMDHAGMGGMMQMMGMMMQMMGRMEGAMEGEAAESKDATEPMMGAMMGMMDEMQGMMGNQNRQQAAPAPSTAPATPAPVIPQETTNLTQTATAGAITVEVAPRSLDVSADQWTFDVVLDTHSVDLSFNLADTALLHVGDRVVKATSWDAPAGGHHVTGTLNFTLSEEDRAALSQTDEILLLLHDIGGQGTVAFTWSLPK